MKIALAALLLSLFTASFSTSAQAARLGGVFLGYVHIENAWAECSALGRSRGYVYGYAAPTQYTNAYACYGIR